RRTRPRGTQVPDHRRSPARAVVRRRRQLAAGAPRAQRRQDHDDPPLTPGLVRARHPRADWLRSSTIGSPMAPRACLFAVLLAQAADARALEAPASYRYRIHHQIFGDIGEHRMTVRRENDAIVVE